MVALGTWIKMTDYLNRDELREYDRHMFRSSLVSLFWRIISVKKEQPEGYKLQNLADSLRKGKSLVSRWFSSETPNWEANTISDIANALNVDLHVTAVDRSDGTVYSTRSVTVSKIESRTTRKRLDFSVLSGPSTSSTFESVKFAANG